MATLQIMESGLTGRRGYLLGLTLALTSPWNLGFWLAVIGGQQSVTRDPSFGNSLAFARRGGPGRGRVDAGFLRGGEARRQNLRATRLAGRHSGDHFAVDALLRREITPDAELIGGAW